MVRQTYSHNRVFPDIGFDLLFGFTGLSGQIIGDLAPEQPTAPLPVSQLPSNWIIDWRRFHELDTPAGTPDFTFNLSRKIHPRLVAELHSLPNGGGHLAFPNPQRRLMPPPPPAPAAPAATGPP